MKEHIKNSNQFHTVAVKMNKKQTNKQTNKTACTMADKSENTYKHTIGLGGLTAMHLSLICKAWVD